MATITAGVPWVKFLSFAALMLNGCGITIMKTPAKLVTHFVWHYGGVKKIPRILDFLEVEGYCFRLTIDNTVQNQSISQLPIHRVSFFGGLYFIQK